jgi:hypothetical protein
MSIKKIKCLAFGIPEGEGLQIKGKENLFKPGMGRKKKSKPER